MNHPNSLNLIDGLHFEKQLRLIDVDNDYIAKTRLNQSTNRIFSMFSPAITSKR